MATSTSKDWPRKLSLHEAVREGNCSLVDKLLLEGANIEEEDQYGYRPLHIAVSHGKYLYSNDNFLKLVVNGNEDVVDILLSRGASVDAKNLGGETPLHIATRFYQISIVEKLLNKGASLAVRNFDDETPLDITVHKACVKPKLQFLNDILKVANLLLKHSAEVDWNMHRELLHRAVSINMVSLVETLVERGIDVNVRDSSDQTALHVAVETNNAELVNKLIDKGADIDAEDMLDKTPLNRLVEQFTPDKVEVLEILVNREASLDIPYQNDYTPLHAAVIGQSSSLVETLLQRGFSVNLRDHRGVTPLHEACVVSESSGLINLLLERGADLEALDNDYCSPLQVAIRRGSISVVKLLLSKGADVNSKSILGDSPLHAAINHCINEGNSDKVLELLIHGASLETNNNAGRSPLQLICDTYHDWHIGQHADSVANWLITCRNHILKMYSAGLIVLGTIAIECIRKIDIAVNHKQLEEEYCQELKIINNTTVGENKLGIVFSSFSRPYYLANNALLRSIQELIDSPHLCQMFPHYSMILKLSISKSRNTYNLYYVAALSLNNLLSHNQVLPSEIIFKIVELLDDSAQCQLVKSGLCCVPSSLARNWCDDLPDSIRQGPVGHYLSDCEIQQLLRNMELKQDSN